MTALLPARLTGTPGGGRSRPAPRPSGPGSARAVSWPGTRAAGPLYTRILHFQVTKGQCNHPGRVRIDAVRRRQRWAARKAIPDALASRLPPAGAELVPEVDDVAGERDLAVAAGWSLERDLQDRAWGLTDFRVADPAGYYLWTTSRTG